MGKYPVILNSTNVVSGTNNSVYEYTFPAGGMFFKNSTVGLNDVSLYYSWYNITEANDNNVFQFIWYGTLQSTKTVTIDDGFYDITTLNEFLQSYCVDNGLYLINGDGDYVYYIEFQENSALYGVQLNCYPIPTALPAGWSEPSNWQGYWGGTTSCPQLIVPDTNFQYIIGFNVGTYPDPTQSTTYSKVSDFTPQVTPVQSIIMTCSLLKNKYSIPNTILYSFAPTGIAYGELYESRPPEIVYVPIQDGTYDRFTIQFLDQNLNALDIVDNNIVIMLIFDDRDEENSGLQGGRIRR
jgi:hypothetical protein